MGLLTWEWKFYIAPAPIIEKQNPFTDQEVLYRHWGMFISKKIFKGFKHPVAGDMVSVPNYGHCKVERVIIGLLDQAEALSWAWLFHQIA